MKFYFKYELPKTTSLAASLMSDEVLTIKARQRIHSLMTQISKQFNLEGKVAIITGSSKGIGKAIAKGLAENGAQVVISSRDQEACDAVAIEFEKEGLKAISIACHIGKEDAT